MILYMYILKDKCMFLDSVGIILRKNDLLPHKIVLLDKIQGKMECINKNAPLPVGALITYNIKKQGSTYFISDSRLVYVPLMLASNDLLFFHHVLELIYYFTAIGNCSSQLFDLFAFLYSREHTPFTPQGKKFFLFKMLNSIGNIPEINTHTTKMVSRLNTITIEQLDTVILSILDEKALDRWLWCCIWQHPYVNEFKTIHFLSENRAL